jgi:hypothetical protein
MPSPQNSASQPRNSTRNSRFRIRRSFNPVWFTLAIAAMQHATTQGYLGKPQKLQLRLNEDWPPIHGPQLYSRPFLQAQRFTGTVSSIICSGPPLNKSNGPNPIDQRVRRIQAGTYLTQHQPLPVLLRLQYLLIVLHCGQ